MITRTHTKTYALDGCASTLPWDRTTRAMRNRTPMVGDPCAEDDCRQPLLARQACYMVVERDDDGWVCWRHIRPDDGPLTVTDAA